MPDRDVIVIGGSLGAHDVIRQIVRAFPANLQARIFVAVHRNDLYGIDHLPSVLSRLTSMPVSAIREAQFTRPGNIYIAPGIDRLIFYRDVVQVQKYAGTSSRGSIDAMFRSAAQAYGERVIGVIVSGMLEDGAEGFGEVRRLGGITIAQNPHEAEQSSMPQSAMQRVLVDYCLRANEIGPQLVRLVQGSTGAPVAASA